MKRFILGLVMMGMVFTAGSVLAADVSGTWTVPDAYVSEMSDMTIAKYMYDGCQDCVGLDPEVPADIKACFSKMVVQQSIINHYITWKKEESPAIAKAAMEESIVAMEAFKEAYRNSIKAADNAEYEFKVEVN